MTLVCDRMEASRRGAGNTADGSNPEIAYTIGGLAMSLPSNYTGKVARGAASELLASAHLMAQGYHVFRALAASCPCDLIAWRADEPALRVEVKTGNPVRSTLPAPSNDEWDLLLVVHSDGLIVSLRNKGSLAQLKQDYWDIVAPGYAPHGTQTHCKRGHEFTPETTYRAPGNGSRSCRVCASTLYAERQRRATR